MERLAAMVLAAIVAASPALAGSPVEQRRVAPADGVVEVEMVSGSVRVVGWERAEVEVTGTLGRGTENLILEGTGHLTVVRVTLPPRCRRCEGSDLTVRVPQRSRVEVNTASADVSVTELAGTVTATSVSGAVSISGGPRRVEAKSSSGCVFVDGVTAPVHAGSISGDVRLTEVVGRVEASSVSGEVLVKGGEVTRCELGTTSGSVRFVGRLAGGAYFKAASVSGDVDIQLPGDVDASFVLSTFSGEIVNELGPKAEKSSRYTSEKQVAFALGRGRARVEATSFSGTIRLRKR